MKRKPLLIGLITAIAMMAGVWMLHEKKEEWPQQWQFAVYAIYAGGIMWALLQYRRSADFEGKFSALFNQGFRCFIVVTLLMVVFTIIFLQAHPELARQEAMAVTEFYIQKGDKTPGEIADLAARAKKQYPVTVVSLSIFRYLIIGALLTAAGSFLLNRRD